MNLNNNPFYITGLSTAAGEEEIRKTASSSDDEKVREACRLLLEDRLTAELDWLPEVDDKYDKKMRGLLSKKKLLPLKKVTGLSCINAILYDLTLHEVEIDRPASMKKALLNTSGLDPVSIAAAVNRARTTAGIPAVTAEEMEAALDKKKKDILVSILERAARTGSNDKALSLLKDIETICRGTDIHAEVTERCSAALNERTERITESIYSSLRFFRIVTVKDMLENNVKKLRDRTGDLFSLAASLQEITWFTGNIDSTLSDIFCSLKEVAAECYKSHDNVEKKIKTGIDSMCEQYRSITPIYRKTLDQNPFFTHDMTMYEKDREREADLLTELFWLPDADAVTEKEVRDMLRQGKIPSVESVPPVSRMNILKMHLLSEDIYENRWVIIRDIAAAAKELDENDLLTSLNSRRAGLDEVSSEELDDALVIWSSHMMSAVYNDMFYLIKDGVFPKIMTALEPLIRHAGDDMPGRILTRIIDDDRVALDRMIHEIIVGAYSTKLFTDLYPAVPGGLPCKLNIDTITNVEKTTSHMLLLLKNMMKAEASWMDHDAEAMYIYSLLLETFHYITECGCDAFPILVNTSKYEVALIKDKRNVSPGSKLKSMILDLFRDFPETVEKYDRSPHDHRHRDFIIRCEKEADNIIRAHL